MTAGNACMEQAVLFKHAGADMLGICSLPSQPQTIGVLILVGGPQYRVGSHRQFVLLAKKLAEAGTATMRFDFPGTGDSSGPGRTFEDHNEEIRAAVNAFLEQVPALKQVVLWGLCDAASAALFYAPTDQRVAGLVLLNPWVRSQAGLAKTHLKHYYGARLRDPLFWRKLFSGGLNVGAAAGGWLRALKLSRQRGPGRESGPFIPFQQRMAEGWRAFAAQGAIQLILSGDDFTAKEFLEYAVSEPAWAGMLQLPHVTRQDFVEADHTFSCAEWRDQVAQWTIDWLDSIQENSR